MAKGGTGLQQRSRALRSRRSPRVSALPEQPEAQFSRAQLRLLHLDARFGRVILIAAITLAAAAGSILLTLAMIAAFFGVAEAWSSWAYVAIPLICVVAIAPAMLGYVLGLLDTVARISEDYRRLAEVDQLTGTLNRRGLFDRSSDLPAGTLVVLADIDHFKNVNDVGGHIAGDRALVEVAAALATLGGPDALLARTGGDEFVLLVPPGSGGELVTNLSVQVPPGHLVSVTLGWAEHRAGAALDESMALADDAMYAAKRPDD